MRAKRLVRTLSLTRLLISYLTQTRKELIMGAVKKAYMDFCEKQDKNPDEDLTGSDLDDAMQDFEHRAWRKEFDDWLDGLAKTYSRDWEDSND